MSSLGRHETLRMRTEWMARERKERRLADVEDAGRTLMSTTVLLVCGLTSRQREVIALKRYEDQPAPP